MVRTMRASNHTRSRSRSATPLRFPSRTPSPAPKKISTNNIMASITTKGSKRKSSRRKSSKRKISRRKGTLSLSEYYVKYNRRGRKRYGTTLSDTQRDHTRKTARYKYYKRRYSRIKRSYGRVNYANKIQRSRNRIATLKRQLQGAQSRLLSHTRKQAKHYDRMEYYHGKTRKTKAIHRRHKNKFKLQRLYKRRRKN